MSELYRYPCACGNEHLVALHQAGESIHCQCGRDLDLPTMRQLRSYPPVEGSEGGTRPTWSAVRGVVFNVGLVVFLGSLAALVVFGWQRWNLDVVKPPLPDSELYQQEVSRWPVEVAWNYWTLAKKTDLSYRQTPQYQAARQLSARLALVLVAAAVGLAIGLVAMVAALLGQGPRSGRTITGR